MESILQYCSIVFYRHKSGRSLCISGELLGDKVPVHELVEEGLHVRGTKVLVVEVICVLPHVHGEQRHGVLLSERAVRANGLRNLKTRRSPNQPRPARAEGSCTLNMEAILKRKRKRGEAVGYQR